MYCVSFVDFIIPSNEAIPFVLHIMYNACKIITQQDTQNRPFLWVSLVWLFLHLKMTYVFYGVILIVSFILEDLYSISWSFNYG